MAKHLKPLGALMVTLATLFSGVGAAAAQEAGTSASVVLADDLGISLDGNLDDWVDIPSTTTVSGPLPSADPGANGRLRWQVAADRSTLYFAATITDDNIIAGQHGGDYWNEDSFELYVNFSGDLAATTYGPGISQVRISANDIGTGGLASLSGEGLDQVAVSGVVFATDAGWGTEIAVDVSAIAQPNSGDRFGLQVHANGASTLDRDLKIIWSARDTEDTSFVDPSVFGQGVFIEGTVLQTAETDSSATGEDPPETIGAAVEDSGEVAEVTSIVTDPVETESETNPQRALLYSAIASAIFVFGGGLWIERKRRADEERHRQAKEERQQEARVAAVAELTLIEDPTDDEFHEIVDGILDDDGAPTES